MSGPSLDNRAHTEPPLWSVGLAVLVILTAPVFLYSWAPTAPLREGDSVFSDGQQRARIIKAPVPVSARHQDTCLLDPDNPLIVLELSMDRLDGMLRVQVQGNQTAEWPFCPPHSEVMLSPHQVFQTPSRLSAVRRLADRFDN